MGILLFTAQNPRLTRAVPIFSSILIGSFANTATFKKNDVYLPNTVRTVLNDTLDFVFCARHALR